MSGQSSWGMVQGGFGGGEWVVGFSSSLCCGTGATGGATSGAGAATAGAAAGGGAANGTAAGGNGP